MSRILMPQLIRLIDLMLKTFSRFLRILRTEDTRMTSTTSNFYGMDLD